MFVVTSLGISCGWSRPRRNDSVSTRAWLVTTMPPIMLATAAVYANTLTRAVCTSTTVVPVPTHLLQLQSTSTSTTANDAGANEHSYQHHHTCNSDPSKHWNAHSRRVTQLVCVRITSWTQRPATVYARLVAVLTTIRT